MTALIKKNQIGNVNLLGMKTRERGEDNEWL